MDDEIILKTKELIKSKYGVSETIALKYAKMALDSFESHGGVRTDFSGVIKIVDNVVKSWLKDRRYI